METGESRRKKGREKGIHKKNEIESQGLEQT